MSRGRSYFTHLLHPPTTTSPACVLESWDAEAWVKEYAPRVTKTLAKGTLPVANCITLAKLTAFRTKPQAGPTDQSGVVCPGKLRQNPSARGELFSSNLKA
jgi:hypothetical protein